MRCVHEARRGHRSADMQPRGAGVQSAWILIIHPLRLMFKGSETFRLATPVPPIQDALLQCITIFMTERSHSMKKNDFRTGQSYKRADGRQGDPSNPSGPTNATQEKQVVAATAKPTPSAQQEIEKESWEGIIDRLRARMRAPLCGPAHTTCSRTACSRGCTSPPWTRWPETSQGLLSPPFFTPTCSSAITCWRPSSTMTKASHFRRVPTKRPRSRSGQTRRHSVHQAETHGMHQSRCCGHGVAQARASL